MHADRDRSRPTRRQAALRIAVVFVRVIVFQSLVCALAAAPPVLALHWFVTLFPSGSVLVPVALAALLVPAYAGFALLLLFVSALSGRLLAWSTPPDVEMRLDEFSRPLLRWVEYMAAIHVVRFFAGGLLRGTPVWTAYLRLAGASIGRRVYVNSLALSDYNLLEFGDDVVIGADAHISGHTVERGVVKTARVRLGRGVVVGIEAVIDIGVDAGDRCQIAALAFVPKFARLAPDCAYGGIPARPLTTDSHHRQAT
jgi:acetyltransferase-like isoleucine patch superfamily enzyme